jgi:RNA polymerase sigma factor (sigma-70 family)
MKNIKSQLSHYSFFKYNREKYEEDEIISGILNNDDKMIRYIYKLYYPSIKIMVNSFRNLVLVAEDIFQEGLMRAVINVREQKFKGESSFKTYLSSICRNICLKELKIVTDLREIDHVGLASETTESDQDALINRMTFLKNNMDENCKQIIDLRFGLSSNQEDSGLVTEPKVGNIKFEDIAKLLDVEVDNARQRFKRCLEKLKLVILKDHHWKEIIS